jgi:NADH:ubiquinone oxidoreductase subunit F (NADH-binding)
MRLLTDSGPSLAEHQAVHGSLPLPPRAQLLDAVEAAGLLGRGGAGFPTARKMRTVAAGRHPVVLGNGCEGEPASKKDALLLARHPHLVLDGLDVAAAAVGAKDRHLAVHAGSLALPSLRAALRERRSPITLHEVPVRYTASEESALISFINTGTAKPLFTPPRPFEEGIGRRPTLVNNAETLAQLALIARRGPVWFRELGDPEEPGTHLLTVDGSVMEVPTGRPLHDVVDLTGKQAVLVGGYFGAWLSAAQAREVTLTHRDLRAAGGAMGAGIILSLPSSSCGLVETARVAAYLANENAGQCGPCFNGLPAIANAVRDLAIGPWDDATMTSLDRWLGVVPGRGACRHPDGAVGFVLSALSVFADDVAAHRSGRPCTGAHATPVLPVPRRAAA